MCVLIFFISAMVLSAAVAMAQSGALTATRQYDTGTVGIAAVQLIAGRSASLSLNADTDLPAGGGRVQVHATALTPTPATAGAPCTLVPTLEVLDNTSGKTTVVVKGRITWPEAGRTVATARTLPK